MRHLEPGDHHPDLHRAVHTVLGPAHRPRHRDEMSQEIGVGIGPVVDLVDRHDKRVTGLERGNRQEGGTPLVAMDEVTGELARDDAGEDGRHETR